MLYRRFGIMHAKLLLYKQAELQKLEEALDNLDQEEVIGMRQMTSGEPQNRSAMLSMLKQNFAEYCKQTILLWISFRFKSDSGFCNSRVHIAGTRLQCGHELENR